MTTDTSAEALFPSDVDPKRIRDVADGLRRQGEFEAARMLDSYAAEKLLAAEHCMCPACAQGLPHDSDCAVHNEPAIPIGPCNCSKRPSIDAAMQGRPNGVFEMMGLPELPSFPSTEKRRAREG